MELLQLKYFKAVADSEKIKTTAAELYISPPALSASISRLERELGVKLFDRGNNKISLNKQGRIFLQYVNQVLTNLETAKIEVRNSLQESSETIHIGVTNSDLWLDLFATWTEQFPDIKLSSTTLKLPQLAALDMANQYSFLLADAADIAFYSAKPSNLRLSAARLFSDAPYVIVPAAHPLAKRKRVKLQELENENIYLPMAEQSLNMRLRKAFRDADFTLRNSNEYSANICQHMVSKGNGISFSTHYTPHTTAGVCYIPLTGLNCVWEQNIYWHKNRVLTKQEEKFQAFVMEYFHSL